MMKAHIRAALRGAHMRPAAILTAMLGMGVAVAMPASAEDAVGPRTYADNNRDSIAAVPPADMVDFDIPQLPLRDALQQYSRVARLSVFYESSLINALRSSPIRGRYAPQAALERLLAGTGFTAKVASDGFVQLQAMPAAAPPPGAAGLRARQIYDREVHARILQALCARPGTQVGRYRLALRFWVNDDQRIGELRVSVADHPELESRVREALTGLPVGAPPPGVAQPAVLLLTPETATRGGGCPP